MKYSLTLFIPGLLPNVLKDEGAKFFAGNQELSALSKLLSRATCRPQSARTTEQCLKIYFDGLGTSNLPAGALSALSHGLISPADNGIWCRADPVECVADQAAAYVLGNAHLCFTTREQGKIVEALNALLRQDGMELSAIKPAEWVCRIQQHTDVVMNDLLEVIRKNMHFYLPSGPDETYWRRLITECQMLMAAQNQPGLSGLWFWGIGRLPTQVHTLFDEIFSNDSVIQGLGQCAQIRVSPLPTQFELSLLTTQTKLFLADLRFITYDKHQMLEQWHALLHEYEEKWFKPLIQALMEGHLHTLIIDCADGREFSLTKKHLSYFWRRVQPLTAFAIDPNCL